MTYDPLDLVYVDAPPRTVPARAHNVRVAESQWTAVGDERGDGGARSVLRTQIRLNGVPLELYLLEVRDASAGAAQLRLNRAAVEITADDLTHLRTVVVRNRRYIPVAVPAPTRRSRR